MRLIASLVAAAVVAAPSAALADTVPPDPAPGGPQRPYEADVAGPDNLDTLTAAVTPDAGRSVTVELDRRSRTASGVMSAAARRFVFLFDRSLTLNPDAFPVCARTVIEASGPGACPGGSRVGGGVGTSFGGQETEVLVFNTRIGRLRGVLVVFPASGVILEQTLERAAAPYRGSYRWALDEIIPPNATPPGQRAGNARFRLWFGATRMERGRAVGFVERRHPAKVLRFGLWSEFVTGQVVLPQWQTLSP
ncbi:hypothetical protein SMC26_37095 [Actinomadura fulvescens]|uniref:Uncharacterized protein n=1 Tax=Actinomadura fulvescens TaxID=46160 RepID=A0ABP6BMZ4_9ACTN